MLTSGFDVSNNFSTLSNDMVTCWKNDRSCVILMRSQKLIEQEMFVWWDIRFCIHWRGTSTETLGHSLVASHPPGYSESKMIRCSVSTVVKKDPEMIAPSTVALSNHAATARCGLLIDGGQLSTGLNNKFLNKSLTLEFSRRWFLS